MKIRFGILFSGRFPNKLISKCAQSFVKKTENQQLLLSNSKTTAAVSNQTPMSKIGQQ